MTLQDKLPVSYLLFTTRGRMNRWTYWMVSLFIWTTFYVLFTLLASTVSAGSTWVLYPLLFWVVYATATKRLHDTNRSGHWLWLVLIPVLGPLVLMYLLGIKRGSFHANRYGAVPNTAADYYKNESAQAAIQSTDTRLIVDDVTRLNPIPVARVEVPETIEALQDVIRNTKGPVSIGGGRFSMGGQTASRDSTHIDMRKLNAVIDFSETTKTITVEAGIRWCDIQQYIDPYQLSIKIMQTYANFTVGGSLSVNCHGRYMGLGPLILSVKSLDIILASGERVHTSPQEKPELFFACVGCYNAIAVIATVELELTANVAVKRNHIKIPRGAYKNYFLNTIRNNRDIVFHNGDIYPPSFTNMRAVSWTQTAEKPTVKTRLMPLASAYPIERYFIGAFSKSRFGKWRREYLIDPIVFSRKKIHPRNYEAGYDVLELEPESRTASTYVLQEYFVPINEFDHFAALMAEIFTRHRVNVINVSVRHAHPDSGSLLAWATEEVFAFVVWYKQWTTEREKGKVAVWTRELIDAALSCRGSYYLPYQAHATTEQFHLAYPHARKLFELKKQLDPHCTFRNVLWDTYYHQSKPI